MGLYLSKHIGKGVRLSVGGRMKGGVIKNLANGMMFCAFLCFAAALIRDYIL